MKVKKRYIEDVLPIGELNKHAQKGARVGSLNAMHPYFARRPLTASRAMTIAALTTAPENDTERASLERMMVALSTDEWPDEPALLSQAQELIRQTHGGRVPRVLDPFAGGGSMPLEAMRMGCETVALDLNPVAYLALISSLVYPQKFRNGSLITDKGGASRAREQQDSRSHSEIHPMLSAMDIAPVLPKSKLLDDIRYWGEWVLEQAEAQIGSCYPVDSSGAVPVAYIWAKTVTCPHCGGEVPLIKRKWLQAVDGLEPIAYELRVDPGRRTYTVELVHGQAALDSTPDKGTIRGASVECIYCHTPTERARIVTEAANGRLSQHLLAIVLYQQGKQGRTFRAANEADKAAYARAAELLTDAELEEFDYWGFDRLLSVVPDEPTPPERARSISIRLYGITKWGDMFNERQKLTLITVGKQIRIVRDLLKQQDPEYARAIALFLSTVVSRYITRNSATSIWDCMYNAIASIFARHDIQMTWDYAEANPFSGQQASWKSQLTTLLASIANLIKTEGSPTEVILGSTTQLPPDWTETFDAIICDPPYYDSVTYADLSDFFYPWHKRIIGDDYPEAFVTELTPKENELVQEAVYHGGTKSAAKQYYEDGMAQAFGEMHRVLKNKGIAVIMFAHKKSSAWETLVNALIRAGFQVTASWPLNTEGRRLQSYRAVALASSIYLVCRKRDSNGSAKGYLEDIEVELRSTIRRYLERFWAAGIGGADFFMSAIGPALSVYSRHETVERYDGQQVTVTEFLNLVRHEVAAFAIERIVGQAGFSERLDALTQFYLLWHWGYNTWDVPDGEALLLSTAVGIELQLLIDRFGLVARVKDKMRLADPWTRKEYLGSVTERVEAGGTVPLVDVMQKACILWDANQQDELAALIANRGSELWPVAQAMVELLPKDNPERRALLSMLGTRHTLENRAQTWVNTHQQPVRPIQTTLWQDEPAGIAPPYKQED